MQTKFLKPNNPLLNKKAEEIPKSQIYSEKTLAIIQTMLKIANGEQKDRKRPVMVGLAAPQIGISKRIILVDVAADGKGHVGDLRVYINPQITWAAKEEVEWYEGCYSTGNVCGIVSRPTSIKIKAYVLKSRGGATLPPPRWKFVNEKHMGYVARIFQHEIDHLNGIRFPDLINDPDKLHWVNKDEFSLYRDKQAWRNWPNKCTFKRWQRLKNPS